MAIASISLFLLHGTVGTEGVVICLANGLLLFVILLQSSLRKRKEMIIIAGMAGADILYGVGAIVLGFYRVYILSEEKQADWISKWDCMLLTAMLSMGLQLSAVMNAVVSCDRLLAVSWPARYRKLDGSYAKKVLVVVALFGFVSFLAMLLSTNFDTSSFVLTTTKLCVTQSVPLFYSLYQYTLIAVVGCFSVVIYIGVFVAYRRSMRQISPNALTNDQQAIIMQRRLTVTLGIITVSTLFLFIIPYSIFAVYAWMKSAPPQASLIGTISRISTIINVFIYVYRQKEVRREIRALVTCKKVNVTNVSTGRVTAR